MEAALLVIMVLTLAGVASVNVLLRFWAPSYLNEKGKNFATKEDIADITHLIEDAKKVHAADLEEVKASLSAEHAAEAERHRAVREFRRARSADVIDYLSCARCVLVPDIYGPAFYRSESDVAAYRIARHRMEVRTLEALTVLPDDDPLRSEAGALLGAVLATDLDLDGLHDAALAAGHRVREARSRTAAADALAVAWSARCETLQMLAATDSEIRSRLAGALSELAAANAEARAAHAEERATATEYEESRKRITDLGQRIIENVGARVFALSITAGYDVATERPVGTGRDILDRIARNTEALRSKREA